MTKRRQLTLLAGISVIVGLVLGFFAGVFSGLVLSLSNGAGEAIIITADLRLLRNGKTEAAISSMEERLDGAILMHGAFQESGYRWRWVLYPWRTDEEFGKLHGYMRKVAQYRKAYPRDTSYLDDRIKDDPRYADVMAWHASLRGEVQRILDKYEK